MTWLQARVSAVLLITSVYKIFRHRFRQQCHAMLLGYVCNEWSDVIFK